VDDEAVCPIHGADVPCRFCIEEEPCWTACAHPGVRRLV